MHPCNIINVTGGFKTQRQTVLNVMSFCVDEMLPLHRTLDIEVHLGNYEKTQNIMGQCLHVDSNEFYIDIDNKQNLYDLILTTCHEMVHVKQYCRKELTEKFPKSFWFGKEHKDGRCYPWELEAWKMQSKLAHKYIKEHTNYTIKAVKSLDKRS
tara:strand:+ start:5135 stop:5596 length:462 start_codon:yes stop_codon:yes gene_type:complete